MNRHFNNIRFIFLLFVGMSTAIISLGSLINFHQNKIWGKPLIPEFIGVKRDHDKTVKVIQSNKTSCGGKILNEFHFVSDGNALSKPFQIRFISVILLPVTSDFIVPVIFLSPSRGLRAPPIS